MTVTIYHNPNCSKSRRALQLLQQHNAELEVIEYLERPPDPATLDEILRLLDLQPRELMRTEEPAYLTLGLEDPALSRTALIAAMCANPILIQRPIVLANGRAVLGRPPEKVVGVL